MLDTWEGSRVEAMGRAAAISAAVVVSAVALVLAAVGDPDARAGSESSLGSRLDDVVAAGVPGALAFVVDGSRRVRLARGVANRETGAELHATDRFRTGSITKSFVAAVVLQLAAEGRLELDSIRSDRGSRASSTRESPCDNCSRTGRVWPTTSTTTPIVSGDFTSNRRLVEAALARTPVAPPGERYSYASTNYLLLGLLVERITGSDLEHELRARIFRPLDLDDTSFEPGVARSSGYGATGRRYTTGSSAVSPWTRAVNRRPGSGQPARSSPTRTIWRVSSTAS